MNTFILSNKTIPDINTFHKAVKSIIPDFSGFNIEDGVITVELLVEVTQDLIDQIEAIVPPTPPVPDVTPRQIRLALLNSGVLLTDIENAINTLPEPQKTQALIAWEYSTAFQRNNPFVLSIGTMLGWSDEQIDALWALAATL